MKIENIRRGPSLCRAKILLLPVLCLTFLLHTQKIVADTVRASLTLSVKEALLEEVGKSPRRFRSLAEIAQSIPGVRGEFVVMKGPAAVELDGTVAARQGRKGKTARIAKGEIPALELVRFLADHTGVPIIYDARDRALAQKVVVVPAVIEQAGYELVKKILESNGFRLSEWKTRKGEPALLLESSALATAPREPEARPIVVLNQPGRGGLQPRLTAKRRGASHSDFQKYAGLVLCQIPDRVLAQVDLDSGRGVLVDEVNRELAAGRRWIAVFKRYDIITHVDGARITTAADFVRILNSMKPGEPFQLRVLRKGITRILRGEK